MLDEQTHDAHYTSDELRQLWRPIPLTPIVPSTVLAASAASLPAASWMAQLAEGTCGGWLASIEDHDKRLEGEDEALDGQAQEDAANELNQDQNNLPRTDVECEICSKVTGRRDAACHPCLVLSKSVLPCRRCLRCST